MHRQQFEQHLRALAAFRTITAVILMSGLIQRTLRRPRFPGTRRSSKKRHVASVGFWESRGPRGMSPPQEGPTKMPVSRNQSGIEQNQFQAWLLFRLLFFLAFMPPTSSGPRTEARSRSETRSISRGSGPAGLARAIA
jgi:hypothetical protein